MNDWFYKLIDGLMKALIVVGVLGILTACALVVRLLWHVFTKHPL